MKPNQNVSKVLPHDIEHHNEESCSCNQNHYHEESCSCSQNHHHEESCSCNQNHHHEESCSCNQNHHHEEHCCEHCESKLSSQIEIPRRILLRIALASILFVLGFFLPDSKFSIFYYIIPYLIIGYDVLLSAGRNILRGQLFDEQFLMALATFGAFVIREYPEAVAVMLFYQIGELFQSLAIGKSRRSIAALMDIRPDYAIVLRDGQEYKVSPDEVSVGEQILIRPGEKVSLDGIVVYGNSSISTAALTGESLPEDITVGSKVLSGSIILDGVITLRTITTYAESTVSKILELVEHAASKKAKVENFITRFSRYYTPFVVLSALLLVILPSIISPENFSVWLNRGLVFLVVSCPCALVISIPLSFFGGIGGASRRGILIKGSNYLEQLAGIQTVIFDKTGTLTKGRFTVSRIFSPVLSEAELLKLAATMEEHSKHPIAECIVRTRNERTDIVPMVDAPALSFQEIHELAGKGIKAITLDNHYYLGNELLMKEAGVTAIQPEEYGTVIHIADSHTYLGYLVICDEIKPDSRAALEQLKRCGIKKTVMLTGDNKKIALSIAQTLSVDEVYAELLPQDKVSILESLLSPLEKLAFVGDGINDAPVLARADVGIAMGGIGSDAAIESADLVLMDDKLSKLPTAIRIARKTMRIVHQNIWFALFSKAVILILGALGIANMWIAVFGDVGVMVLAVLNSMRAMLVKE